MEKPLVCVKVGITLDRIISAAFDAILDRGNYSLAFDLNSRLTDAASDASAFRILLEFIDIYIE
jgi:hypothetical protein